MTDVTLYSKIGPERQVHGVLPAVHRVMRDSLQAELLAHMFVSASAIGRSSVTSQFLETCQGKLPRTCVSKGSPVHCRQSLETCGALAHGLHVYQCLTHITTFPGTPHERSRGLFIDMQNHSIKFHGAGTPIDFPRFIPYSPCSIWAVAEASVDSIGAQEKESTPRRVA